MRRAAGSRPPRGDWGASHQDELAAVGVDVGAEEGDAVRLGGYLGGPHHFGEASGERAGPLADDDCVRSAEAHEPDGHPTVLALGRSGVQMLRQRSGQCGARVDPGVDRPAVGSEVGLRCGAQQEAAFS